MDISLPRPALVDGPFLSELLALASNAKLRRELGAQIVALEPAVWPNPHHQDGAAWADALAELLSSRAGYEIFRKAAEKHNHGPLASDHRLNLLERGRDRVRLHWRQAKLGRIPAQGDDFIEGLLEADLDDEAVFLLWLMWLTEQPTDSDELVSLAKNNPRLSAQFGLAPGAAADPVGAVKRLAGIVATSDRPSAALLAELAAAAGTAAEALAAIVRQAEEHRRALTIRLAASPLAFGDVTLPADAALEPIETALGAAERAAAKLDELDAATSEALRQRNYVDVTRLGSQAEEAKQRSAAARTRLLRLVESATSPAATQPRVSVPDSVPATPAVEADGPVVTAPPAEATPSAADGAAPAGEPVAPVAATSPPAIPSAASPDREPTAAPVSTAPTPVNAPAESPAGALSHPPAESAPHPATAPGSAEPAPAAAPADVSAEVPALPASDGAARAVFASLKATRPGLGAALLDAGALGHERTLLRPIINLVALALIADGGGEIDDRVRIETDAVLAAWPDRPGIGTLDGIVHLAGLSAACLLMVGAPGGAAGRLVDVLRGQPAVPARLNDLARCLDDNGAALFGLWQSSGLVEALASEDEWRAALSRRSEAVREWVDSCRAPPLNNYAPAKMAWSRMLAEGQPLGTMLKVAQENDISHADTLAEQLASFSGEDEWQRIDRVIRGEKLQRERPIRRGAARDLNELTATARRLLWDWMRLATARPRHSSSGGDVQRLRQQLLDLLASASAEVAAERDEPGAPLAAMVLDRFKALLQANGERPSVRTMEALLARDVIGIPGIRIDAAWRMRVPARPDVLAALIGTAKAPPGVAEAVARRITAGEFAEAVLGLDLIANPDQRDALDRQIRDAAASVQAKVAIALATLREEIEAAEATGRLPIAAAQSFQQEIAALNSELEQAPAEDIPDLAEIADQLTERLRDTREHVEAELRGQITTRLNTLDLARAAAIRAPVDRALAQGWLAIAEDLIDRAEAGDAIEGPAEPPPIAAMFAAFYPDRCDQLARWLRAEPAGLGDFVARPDTLPTPTDAAPPTPDETESAQRLARAWIAAARVGGDGTPRALTSLFGELGFGDPRIEGEGALAVASREAWFTLRTAPIQDRDTTLLPDFGSLANGSFNVLALWRQPEVSRIRTALQARGGSASTAIVLFFGAMGSADRRELVRMARMGQLTSVVVLDTTLILHLALAARDRLRTLFACALPFSGIKPWLETGAPPPEMFFGRHDEILKIEATSGEMSHLVYGGRQLGKTALLRQVERRAAGDANRVVRYIDIKRFGHTVPISELWAALTEALSPSVPMVRHPRMTAANRFRSDVRAWLDARPGRSILLLLDEADKFFKEDQAGGYSITEELRALSEQTRRRFKPVFAGLENVQRLARDPNNPIAQFAAPLLIGPLLRGPERREAEALVRWPFAALGFTLAPEVVNRILIFANYYPSLIQLVCQNLLRDLRANGGGGPPWQIGMEKIATLLASAALRRAAFEKFRITLELDQRYYLLALVVAELSRDHADALSSGIAVAELRDYAAAYWPAGFPAEFGLVSFEALLDQMVGLGLLRIAGSQRYALRSANLLQLIGSPRSTSDQLDAFAERPAPPEPDPLEDRRQDDARLPGLLTTREEGQLMGTDDADRIVICLGLGLGGTPHGDASRIEKAVVAAAKALRQRIDAPIEMPKLKPRDLDAFATELRRRTEAPPGSGNRSRAAMRREAGRRLILVPPGAGWTPHWVRAAVAALKGRTTGGLPLRIVFFADATLGWAWCEDHACRNEALAAMAAGERQVVELVPGRWNRPSLDVWLELHASDGALPDWLVNDRDVLLGGTGGWDWALRQVLAGGRDGFAMTDAAGLARQLLAQAPAGAADPFADLRAMPQAVRLLHAVADTEELRRPDEKVDQALVADAAGSATPPPGLAWATAMELVTSGRYGLQLNPLLRVALQGPLAGLR